MENSETHESYGLIGCSRISGGTRNLFGSSINHSNTISLRIKTATKQRHNDRDWYFGRKQLIEVEMSQTQFAEMITSIGVGDGVPCTLRYVNNWDRIPDPPDVNQRLVFEKEFKNHIKKIEESCLNEIKSSKDMLLRKGSITKKEREYISNNIDRLLNIIGDHIPFIQKSFNEAMDKTVSEAKGEVEAFVMNKVTSLGLEKINELNNIIEVKELNEGE